MYQLKSASDCVDGIIRLIRTDRMDVELGLHGFDVAHDAVLPNYGMRLTNLCHGTVNFVSRG